MHDPLICLGYYRQHVYWAIVFFVKGVVLFMNRDDLSPFKPCREFALMKHGVDETS